MVVVVVVVKILRSFLAPLPFSEISSANKLNIQPLQSLLLMINTAAASTHSHSWDGKIFNIRKDLINLHLICIKFRC